MSEGSAGKLVKTLELCCQKRNWLEMLYEPAEGLPSNIGAEPIPVARG